MTVNKNIMTLLESETSEFSGIEFEKDIPYNMRFKEYNIIGENHDELYWITQDSFNSADLAHFRDAFVKTGLKAAYVTERDLSTYEFSRDMSKDVLAYISEDGTISAEALLNKFKELGWAEESEEHEITEGAGAWSARVLGAIEEGILSAQSVAEASLNYLSEDDIEDMARMNDWMFLFDDEENEE